MKKFVKLIVSMLCVAVLSIPCFAAACSFTNVTITPGQEGNPPTDGAEHVDYVSKVKLDFTTNTKKQEVTVKQFIDGDTTHFYPKANSTLEGCNNAADFSSDKAPITTKGFAKARYIAINTPESTIQIEPYGKAASNYTHSKLEKAKSIVIESDDDKWNIDNTGERYVLWIWYIPEDGTEYRNLNIEILQSGHAYGSGTADNRYGTDALAALTQAQEEKLILYSGEPDPDYYYGGPINVDMKWLRFNTEAYKDKKIVVEGTVVARFSNSAYIEQVYYDIEGYESGIRLGMQVFYGYTTGKVLEILSVGNKVSVVGVVQYSDYNGCYQITDIQPYDRYNPDNPTNCKLLESVGLDSCFTKINPADFVSNENSVSVDVEKKDAEGKDYSEVVSMTFKEALLASSVSVSDVTVYDVYTTEKEGTSKGAMTLYCRANDGTEFQVRTEVLTDENGKKMEAKDYLNKKITVKGIVELYNGTYQIKCHRADYITVQN